MKRKYRCVFLLFIIIFAMSACGKDKSVQTNQTMGEISGEGIVATSKEEVTSQTKEEIIATDKLTEATKVEETAEAEIGTGAETTAEVETEVVIEVETNVETEAVIEVETSTEKETTAEVEIVIEETTTEKETTELKYLESASFTKDNVKLHPGMVYENPILIYPVDACDANFIYESSNREIVSIGTSSNGKDVIISNENGKSGSATIYLKNRSGNILDSYTVTVGYECSETSAYYNSTSETFWWYFESGALHIGGKTNDSSIRSIPYSPWSKYGNMIEELYIYDGITTIEKNAFYNCLSLTKVSMSDSVTAIREYAFDNCISLNELTLSNSLTVIPKYMCHGTAINSIELPKNLTTIENSAFGDCASLTSVTIPENVSEIGAYAFIRCTNLESLIFETNKLELIQQDTFAYCKKLSMVELPKSVKHLQSNVFDGCAELKSIKVSSDCVIMDVPTGCDIIYYD